MRCIFLFMIFSIVTVSAYAETAADAFSAISLEEAGLRAVAGNRSLAADSLAAAALLRVRAISALPQNPELETGYSHETLSGDSRWSVSLSQTFGPSGLSRVLNARAEEGFAAAALCSSVLETYRAGIQAGLGVWSAQENLRRYRMAQQNALTVESLTVKRVTAGYDAEAVLLRARADRALAMIAAEQAAAQLSEEQGRCRILWGESSSMSFTISVPTPADTIVPALDSLLESADSSVAAAKAAQTLYRDRQNLAAQKLISIPDLRISGGVEGIPGSSISGFNAALGFEVPIFSRNTAGRVQAAAQLKGSVLRHAEEAQQIRSAVRTLHERYGAACREISLQQNTIVPGAAAYRDAILASYAVGRADYRDIAEANRSCLEAEAALSAAIVNSCSIKADIDFFCTRKPAAHK